MRQSRTGIVVALACILLAWATSKVAWSQTNRLQQVEKRLGEKQAAADAHRKQMESLKDPDKLTAEMQRHFQMTEEIIALMLERRQLAAAQTQPSDAGTGSGSGMQTGGGMGGMQRGGGMEGEMGMMQKEMGGMHGGGGVGRGMMEREMGGMAKGGMSGQAGSSGQSGATKETSEIRQMMQRIAEHSAYMETIKDRSQLSKEMLRHQKMLDQMLELMQ